MNSVYAITYKVNSLLTFGKITVKQKNIWSVNVVNLVKFVSESKTHIRGAYCILNKPIKQKL